MKKLFLSILFFIPFIVNENLQAAEIPNNQIWYTSTDGKVVTPYNLGGFEVGIVSNTYTSGKGIIIFNGNVTSIGSEAFCECSRLTSVTIPNSVTSIGSCAFYYCENLTYINIPNSVISIGDYAFSYSNISSITIPNSVTSIENYAFYYCSNLASITIPNSVTSIKEGTFQGCSKLNSIIIPNSVTSIGEHAFGGCGLTKVYCYADKVPSTDIAPFYYVPLASATLYVPKNSIDSYKAKSPWSGFGTITELPQPNDEIWYEASSKLSETTSGGYSSGLHTDAFNTTITSHTFYNGKGIIKFNGNVTNIGSLAFYECANLTSITIPKSVSSIGVNVFGRCPNLSFITISKGNEYFDSRDNCNAIIKTATNTLISGCKNAIIPNSVKSIGSCAFYGCSSLTSVIIPDSVTSIGNRAFCGCTKLASITIPNSVTSIGKEAFESCSSLESATIGNSVTSIGNSAFCDCTKLASIIIPNSLTSIGSCAFEGCSSLTSITIPDSVTSIGSYAFRNCTSLTSVTIPNLVTSIEEGTFSGCSSFTSITIPNSVTSIGESAFSGCTKVVTVSVGNSVNSIGRGAFNHCTSLANFYCYPEQIPSTPLDAVFLYIPSDASLHVPENLVNTYQTTYAWTAFSTILALPNNVYFTNFNDENFKKYIKANDSFSLSDNIKSIEITDTIPSVNLTYTRNFSDAMVNNWQAWYMPCDFDYDDLSEDFDVAEVAGVLFDKDGQNYVAFRKMTEGIVKAHTPYVVRAKEAGDVVITATTTLQPTSGSKSFSMQSAYNNFTFGGVYENSYLSAEYPAYALNKSGNFAMMASDVYLRPFRIYMRITDREDNPYAAVTAPQEVKVVVLGEDDTTGLIDLSNSSNLSNSSQPIYNLAGQKLQKLQKGINIVNGRKVLF